MRAVACFVVAALASAAINSQLAGCMGFGGDCSCPATPERPEPQGALFIDEVAAFSAAGGEDTLPTDPRGGTAELTGDALIIRYEHAGQPREVTYTVESLH